MTASLRYTISDCRKARLKHRWLLATIVANFLLLSTERNKRAGDEREIRQLHKPQLRLAHITIVVLIAIPTAVVVVPVVVVVPTVPYTKKGAIRTIQ